MVVKATEHLDVIAFRVTLEGVASSFDDVAPFNLQINILLFGGDELDSFSQWNNPGVTSEALPMQPCSARVL